MVSYTLRSHVLHLQKAYESLLRITPLNMNTAPIMLSTPKFLKRYALNVPMPPRYCHCPRFSIPSLTCNSLFSNAVLTITGSLYSTNYRYVRSAYILCQSVRYIFCYGPCDSTALYSQGNNFSTNAQTHLCHMLPSIEAYCLQPQIDFFINTYSVMLQYTKRARAVTHRYFNSSCHTVLALTDVYP